MEKSLPQIEIKNEIRMAEISNRPADFRGKTLSGLFFLEGEINTGLDLEDSIIIGPISLGGIVINGDLNLKGADIRQTFYFSEGTINGNLNMDFARAGKILNLVGSKINGSLSFKGLEINGFLSLSKAQIFGDLDFRNIIIKNSQYEDLTIIGDLYLNKTIIQGKIDLTDAFIEGNLDLSTAAIQGSVNLTNACIANLIILRNALIRGEFILKGTKYKKILKKVL